MAAWHKLSPKQRLNSEFSKGIQVQTTFHFIVRFRFYLIFDMFFTLKSNKTKEHPWMATIATRQNDLISRNPSLSVGCLHQTNQTLIEWYLIVVSSMFMPLDIEWITGNNSITALCDDRSQPKTVFNWIIVVNRSEVLYYIDNVSLYSAAFCVFVFHFFVWIK